MIEMKEESTNQECDSVEFIKDFYLKGYVILDSVFTTDEQAELRSIVERLIDGANKKENQRNDGHWNSQGYLFNKRPEEVGSDDKMAQYLHKIQGVCTIEPSVLEKVFKHPNIMTTVRDIMKENSTPRTNTNINHNIDVFGTKFFPVYPGGNSVSWHQDSHYFGTGPSQQIISCAVYIEKTNVENGCLRLIPGSHADCVEYPHTQGHGKWTQGEWVDVESNEDLKSRIKEVICPRPGTVLLFDARLLHAANENISSDRTRWSFFAHYVPGNLDFSWRGIDFSRHRYKDRYTIENVITSI